MHTAINIVLFAILGASLAHLKIHYDTVWFWALTLLLACVQVNSFIQGYNNGRK